jgi:uncharacterized membrane protein
VASSEDRLAAIEARLDRLEKRVDAAVTSLQTAPVAPGSAQPSGPGTTSQPAAAEPADPWAAFKGGEKKHSARSEPSEPLSITQILGWTGATAIVLAMAYLIRLALDTGWLTPERQLALAVLTGLTLIGVGLWLRSADRIYASLLPAGGLVVLFLSIYGAHLYYQFIEAQPAAGLVILVCIGALWLGRLFASELYALFAVLGSYSAPFLLPVVYGSVIDLVVYFSAWSVAFCIYSIWIGHRRPYLLAAYLALLGFNFLWRGMASAEWAAALSFQVIQFAIFVGGAAGFSVVRARPMSSSEALAHLPLLLIFYALQYELLNDHLPALAPWIALLSAVFVLLAYAVVRFLVKRPLQSGATLVGAYSALALFHAGYMELVPGDLAPWVALLLMPAVGIYLRVAGRAAGVSWPIRALIGTIFSLNYLRVVVVADTDAVPAHDSLAFLYAVELYVAYYLTRSMGSLRAFSVPALYVGHIALLGAAVQVLDNRLGVSLVWGGIALACLAMAFRLDDRTLGKSSLLIFAASAVKVLILDLSDAAPLVRIASLLILGVTLYIGGWMYKRVDALEEQNVPA